jgi:hypothetical protein
MSWRLVRTRPIPGGVSRPPPGAPSNAPAERNAQPNTPPKVDSKNELEACEQSAGIP